MRYVVPTPLRYLRRLRSFSALLCYRNDHLVSGAAALESRIAGTGGGGPGRRLHPALEALLVLAFIILPAVF